MRHARSDRPVQGKKEEGILGQYARRYLMRDIPIAPPHHAPLPMPCVDHIPAVIYLCMSYCLPPNSLKASPSAPTVVRPATEGVPTECRIRKPLFLPREEPSSMPTCPCSNLRPFNERDGRIFRQGRVGHEVIGGTDTNDAATDDDDVARCIVAIGLSHAGCGGDEYTCCG